MSTVHLLSDYIDNKYKLPHFGLPAFLYKNHRVTKKSVALVSQTA